METKREPAMTKISDFLFATYYISLYLIQLLPLVLVFFAGVNSYYTWISAVIALIAMTIQFFKFPCVFANFWHWTVIVNFIAIILFWR